jgi:hypothetical protein
MAACIQALPAHPKALVDLSHYHYPVQRLEQPFPEILLEFRLRKEAARGFQSQLKHVVSD